MGMNLECMLYLQKNGLLTRDKNRLLDIGPQNVYHCTVEQIRQFVLHQGSSASGVAFDLESKRLAYFSTPRPEERTTLFSEITDLTNIEYNAFDVCPAFKTELLDLNFDKLPARYIEHYDVVLNFGTTEHVFNQWNSFAVVHDAIKVGGIQYCVLPASGYLDHGYYCYTPLFFKELAQANSYELLELFFAPAGENWLKRMGSDVRAEAQFDVPHSARMSPGEDRVPCFNIHVLMRKTRSSEFRCALEVATAHSSVNSEMAARYDGQTNAGPSSGHESDLLEKCRRLEREKEQRIFERDKALTERDLIASQIEGIHRSRSWRFTKPFRRVLSALHSM